MGYDYEYFLDADGDDLGDAYEDAVADAMEQQRCGDELARARHGYACERPNIPSPVPVTPPQVEAPWTPVDWEDDAEDVPAFG